MWRRTGLLFPQIKGKLLVGKRSLRTRAARPAGERVAGWGRLLFLWRMETVISAASRMQERSTAHLHASPEAETHRLRLVRRKVFAFGLAAAAAAGVPSLLRTVRGIGGRAAESRPSPVETYNDLDGEVVNFFRVLRDEKERLVEAIGLTPFSREEFALACEIDPELQPLERARRFYVRARQVRTGLAQTATLGRWANCKDTSRAGMSGVISRWLGAIEACLKSPTPLASADRKPSGHRCHSSL